MTLWARLSMLSFSVSVMVIPLLMRGVVPMDDYPFRNISLPWEDRVNDLVGRLTLAEVMFQLAKGGFGRFGGPAPAIKRLGIGPYSWNTECLRGDAEAGNATSYPQAIGLAAAFSTDLIFRVSEATAVEVHAKYNDYVKKGQYGDHKGLSCFSPVINILRDPRWGRNQ
ncbi:xylan 1,4-beta-xylosidase-like, partial [Gigantopelta aegis]|uniref:xylan 1,4-beta-xylosidase-like n=1 Tax=Gigantopelta aegis TaxID=1735272 RepID=UPI001B88CEED